MAGDFSLSPFSSCTTRIVTGLLQGAVKEMSSAILVRRRMMADTSSSDHDPSAPATEDSPGHSVDDLAWREYDIHESINGQQTDHEDLLRTNNEEEEQQQMASLFQTDGDELKELEFSVRLPSSSSNILLHLTCQEDYTQSTGMAIWKGSDVLAQYLMQHPEIIQNKSVLELGAGVGLVGLVAHHLGGRHVIWTDGDSTVLQNLRHNVQRNYSKNNYAAAAAACAEATQTKSSSDDDNDREETAVVEDFAAKLCPQLIWGKQLETFQQQYGQFQVILGTDLFYMTRSLDPLFATIDHLLTSSSPDGRFVAVNSCASQSPMSTVFQVALCHGLECTTSSLLLHDDDNPDDANFSLVSEKNKNRNGGSVQQDEGERIYIFSRKK